jgi:TonB-linked SusC/RagA family outer membrane protein
MYNFQTAGTNNHYIDPANVVVSTKTRDDGNYVYKENQYSESYQLNFFATYERTFGKHDLGAVFVYEQSEGDSERFDAQRNKLISWEMPEFFGASGDATESTVGAGSVSESGRLSYVGRINYSYDEKYLLETAFRVDGSTKFAPSERWGFFPSVSAGWRVSSEPFFMNNVHFMDYLKIRGSIATLGNDAIGGWQWMSRYGITSGTIFSALAYGLEPKEIPNPKLTWEKSASYNIGFDSRMFKSKLNLSFEYFFRHTYDILDNLNVSVPTTFGASLPKENYSQVNSRGIELELGYNDKIGDLRYYVRGNFSYARSWWAKKDEAENIRPYKSQIGKSLSRDWGFECIGMIRTEEQLKQYMEENPKITIKGQKPGLGMLIYRDVRGPQSDEPDGIITDDDKVVIVKNKIAPITYGFTIGGSLKGFMLDVFFQGMAGHKKVMDFRGNGINAHTSTFKYYNDHWTPENPNASMPGATQYKNNEVSSFWVRNASFLRCKNVSLSYDLPQRLVMGMGMKKVRVFVNGTNLFLLQDHVKWMDPEATSISDYPVMRNFSLGVNITI